MTDPLRPFADAIRQMWRTRNRGLRKSEAGVESAAVARDPAAKRSPSMGESLRARLSARIAGLDPANPRRLREAFVETVLLWQLGEQLAPDPAFGELVLKVSEQLVSDPQTSERLHRLLLDIAGETSRG